MPGENELNLLLSELESHLPLGDESRRLFHGRGQVFAGYEDLLIDWYAPVVLVTLYRERSEDWLVSLTEVLCSRCTGLVAVVLQERFRAGSPSRLLYGKLPEEVQAVEAGLFYRVNLNAAQNIGFFLDMGTTRAYVRAHSGGKKILNLFAYTCSFSVAAIAGGATQVINLDMSRNALDLGRLNHQLNQLEGRKSSYLAMELFRSISRLKKLGPFDMIICDPPADQGRSFSAERDWPKLVRKLPPLLSPGGELLACASSPDISPGYIDQLINEYWPAAVRGEIIQAGADFPEVDTDKGLNALSYQFP
ncbi:MAG: SAM-dependent methyltransferase [Desulfuromonas sp.]|nr:MAG: SAM-dependent methyltransferase [Desulfuromonas sp.]